MRIVSPGGYPLLALDRETLVESLGFLRSNRNAAAHFADTLVEVLTAFVPVRELVFRRCADAAFAWYAVNVDASIVSCELALSELQAPEFARLVPGGSTPVEYLASLVARRDFLQTNIESLEGKVANVEAPGLNQYLHALWIDPLRRDLAAFENEISVLQARIESAPAADAAAMESKPLEPPKLYGESGRGLY